MRAYVRTIVYFTADCARVYDVCICGEAPCAHACTKPEFVYDPRKMCIFKRDCTGLVEVACIGGYGVRDSLRATSSWCGSMRTQLYSVELSIRILYLQKIIVNYE